MQESFDFEDAQASLALTDMASFLLKATQALGAPVAACLQGICFPMHGIAAPLGQKFLETVFQLPEKRQFAHFLQQFVLQLRT